MKIAVVGSRGIKSLNLACYLTDANEIVSGGAEGVDSCAEDYAREKGIKLTLFLPEYSRYGRAAPIVRNKKIVDYADKIVVFWDGSSKGTLSVIKYAEKVGKPCEIVRAPKFNKKQAL